MNQGRGGGLWTSDMEELIDKSTLNVEQIINGRMLYIKTLKMLPIPLSSINSMSELLLPKEVMDFCILSCLVSLMTNVLYGCPGLEMQPLSVEHN